MKTLRVVLFVVSSALTLASFAVGADKPGWFVVTDAYGQNPKNESEPKTRIVALRDDGKVRVNVRPKPESSDRRVFSPNGKMWFELCYNNGGSVRDSFRYLLIGTKDQADKDVKPLLDKRGPEPQPDYSILQVETAQWTASNNILLSSGYVDWGAGVEVFSYHIINPVTEKDVVDLDSLRKSLLQGAKYEEYAALSSDESQLLCVVRSPAMGTDSGEAEHDHNTYLISFDFKRKFASVVCAFRANIQQPQWNAMGTECVFFASNGTDGSGSNLVSNIYVYLKKYNEIEQLTNSRLANSSPSWSPDGKHIVWISNHPGKRGSNADKAALYTMNADGTNQKLFSSDVNAVSVRWQKDEPK